MAEDGVKMAPGAPGIEARWTSSAKVGVGAALNNASRVWFTLSHGIIDEIYYSRVDWACTRDMGLLVADGKGWVSDEKRQAQHKVSYPFHGVPYYCLTNTDVNGRYQVEKEILADPQRDVVLQRTRFTALEGKLEDYRLCVLLAPHLGNQGAGNTAWVGETKGMPMLFAERDGTSLALGCSAPWTKRSAGYVGSSDGWQDVTQHGEMTWQYERAENGNVALTGEIDLAACGGEFTLALGLSRSALEAGHHARASLFDGFDAARDLYVKEWEDWQAGLLSLGDEDPGPIDEFRTSAFVLRLHEDKVFSGGMIASLSIPWGYAKGDDDLGGYHLVWTRDLVEAVGGLIAAGAQGDAGRVLRYLQVTQEDDGHWAQNMWLDGTPYWTGIQMDETAFPILLTETAYRLGVLDEALLESYWGMVRQAAAYVVANGPVSKEDRWEENAGYSPFTLAVEIAGLLAAASLAETTGKQAAATYLRETADNWNANIERWTYVTGTELAKQYGVEGYYVRIAPPDVGDGASIRDGYVPIKNQPPGQSDAPAGQIVSPDALALVRFGLRAPDDPCILNTIKIIDATLKVNTPAGPVWHRYTDDGYGDQADGSPFDGSGIGRGWPLLVGERAHYELAAGRFDEAEKLMHVMEALADEGGMIPEQTWDAADIPDKELFFGRPAGSAMPLVWAHAEYLKLRRSLRERRVIDMPPQPLDRYLRAKHDTPFTCWRFNQKVHVLPSGKVLRVETRTPAVVHWSADGWHTTNDCKTEDTSLSIHHADLPTDKLPTGTKVSFTFRWPEAGDKWEGTNYEVQVTD
jgi:glucoamylase